MLRLLSNVDLSRLVSPTPQPTFTLVKRSQVGQRAAYTERSAPMAVRTTEWPVRRSSQTTNTERRLADLEWAVVNGLITAVDADRLFGSKPAGSRGRVRKAGQEDFASWLRTRIARLSDRGALAALVDEVQRLQSDRRPGRASRVRALNRRIGEHDPEYVARLRGALAELYAALTPASKASRQATRTAKRPIRAAA